MAIEKDLYTQVVMICQKHSDNKEQKKKTKKYIFKEMSARSLCWPDLDHGCLEANFSTFEPNFYYFFIK